MQKLLKRALRLEPGISLAQWVYDTLAATWPQLFAVFLAGGGMSYLATITAWASFAGPLGVGAVGLASALLTYLGLSYAWLVRSKARERDAMAAASKEWSKAVDGINPMDGEFTRKRIGLNDIAHPISRRVIGKKFIDCEIIGPGAIVFRGTKSGGTTLDGLALVGCDVVVMSTNTRLMNVVVFDDVKMLGGAFWNMTIYIPIDFLDTFLGFGANVVSKTGVPEIDNQPLPDKPAR